MLLALAGVLAGTVLVACGGDGGGGGGDDDGGALQEVTLMLDWTPNTNHSGFYLARTEGYYRDAGLDVTIIEPSADGGLPQLAAGNAEFAVSVAEQLLPARQQGADVVSVGAILAHNTSSLVIPADRGVTTAKDLEGKTYGGFGGELEKALLDTLVSCDGGDPSKVEFVEVGNVDYSQGFRQGDYDAVWVFDGWDVIRLRDILGLEVTTIPFYASLGSASCIPDWYTPLVATSQQLIDEDPALVEAFMAATAKGFEDARTDPDGAAAALLAAAPELDADLVERSAAYLADHYGDPGQPWGVQDPQVWTRFADFLKEHDLLDAEVDPAEAFTNDFLPGATDR
ncbi:MAG: ABC transporter substrate-binding protein [Acidimicrobiales bacterium]